MFKRLLVPLDGSQLAETAIPAAVYLAKVLNASVTLIHTIERNAPKEIHSERHLTNPEEAQAYLDEITRKWFSPDIKVESHVHTSLVSDVARSIADHADELQPDLVIMCTHGRRGPKDVLFGSIAQQVINMGETPVLLIRPVSGEPPKPFSCKQLLVPLDGLPDHEQGVPTAISLAKACEASISLLMVVPTYGTLSGDQAVTSRLNPGATSAALDLAEVGASEYLRQRLQDLISDGLKATAEVKRGDPASTIVDTAEETNTDIIVFGTHGKAGTDAFWSGSVTPKVSSHTHIPLLLVPVRES
ncbi:MAG: universal stress protein [Omnitrophica WOR_2 bacterium]